MRLVATRSEEGFTLIELLLVLVLIPLVMGAIAVVVISSLKDQSAVSSQVSDSASANVASAYFVRDVQSAMQVTTAPSPASAPSLCGSGSSHLLSVQVTPTTVISYWLIDDGATVSIVRIACTGGPPQTSTLVRDVKKVPAPSATIAPAAFATSASSDWTQPSNKTGSISGITLSGVGQASNHDFSLLAAPRPWTSASIGQPGNGNPATPPLLLLGSSPTVLNCQLNGVVNVNGQAAFDPTGSPAVRLDDNCRLSATSYYTANQKSPSQTISTNGSASYTPSPIIPGPIYPDPYATTLTPPSTSGMPQYSDGNYHGPGEYTQPLDLTGSNPQIFATGVYVFDQGFSFTDTTVRSAPGGVLFYVAGGGVTIDGNATVDLSHLSAGTYQNIVLWQAASDTNSIRFDEDSNTQFVGGALYAPKTHVDFTLNANFVVGSIAIQSMSCTDDSSMSIG